MPEVQQGTATGILFYEARKLELEAVAAAMIVMVTATHVGRKTRCAGAGAGATTTTTTATGTVTGTATTVLLPLPRLLLLQSVLMLRLLQVLLLAVQQAQRRRQQQPQQQQQQQQQLQLQQQPRPHKNKNERLATMNISWKSSDHGTRQTSISHRLSLSSSSAYLHSNQAWEASLWRRRSSLFQRKYLEGQTQGCLHQCNKEERNVSKPSSFCNPQSPQYPSLYQSPGPSPRAVPAPRLRASISVMQKPCIPDQGEKMRADS